MKNKAVTIVCVILIISAIICFGYIFINSKIKGEKKEEKPEETINTVNNEVVEREERGQNVNVNSRIGQQLKELIKYSEIYSNDIIEELDKGGISSKTKLLVGLDKISRKEEYQSYLGYSDEYNNTYILSTNMNQVISNSFVDSTLSEKDVDGILNYDNATNVYVVVPRAFQTGSIGYTLEIPYKVTEYTDRVELEAYRIYVTKNIEMNQAESIVEISLYYDKAKSIQALTITNDPEYSENNQVDYVKGKIDSGEIKTDNIESVKYTFNQVDGEYRILSFGKIK
ncbi:MAG: hypothetical protein ACI4ON_04475 [Clostridia bacterium]